MDLFKKFLNEKNFDLAWRRINTGTNAYYKRYFRDVYWAYEIALEKNLDDLIRRIKGHSYRPQPTDRVYVPKKSGLHRPVTILTVEDQIVWQAIANVLDLKWAERRKRFEKKVVFSNLANPNKIFFFEHWKISYTRLLKKIRELYQVNKWIAHFDLAAYFDTISHNHIINLISPRDQNSEFASFVKKILSCWTSEKVSQSISHGIPQGPIASSYIGELVFLDIDNAMMDARRGFHYLRYVDDIRILSDNVDEVRDGVAFLETLCRNKGLIPQSQKTTIFYAETEEDAVGKDFSITAETENESRIEKSMLEAIDFKKKEIIDLTKFRFILNRSPAFEKHLDIILQLFEKYPHISDAFVTYISRFVNNDNVINFLSDMLQRKHFPYQYVEGNTWLLLSIVDPERKSRQLSSKAKGRLFQVNVSFYLRYGLLMYLSHFVDSRRLLNKYLYEDSAVLQSMLLSNLAVSFEDSHYREFLSRCFSRTKPDAGIVAAQRLAEDNISYNELTLPRKRKHPAVRNTLVYLGVVKGRNLPVATPFQEIILSRYKVDIVDWSQAVKGEFKHAHRILVIAEKAFEINRSSWLCSIDSFNEILTRSLIALDQTLTQRLSTSQGHRVQYGVLLDPNTPFSNSYKIIADNFRVVHKRRCSVPEAHPYDEKTSRKARPLQVGERNNLYGRLKVAYNEINEAYKILI